MSIPHFLKLFPPTDLIFFGTSDFAVPALEALVKSGYKIAAVVTSPDKPTGRKQTLTPPPVKIAAEKLGLKVLQFLLLKIVPLRGISRSGKNCPATRDLAKREKLSRYAGSRKAGKIPQTDLGVVVAYGKIIPKEIIDLFLFGIINIHPSLLPKYRGPSPIQSAILNEEKETGVTLIKIDEELDHGPIIANFKFQISNFKFEELHKKLAKLGADLLVETLPDYLRGKIKPQPQDHSQATFTKKFTRADGRINWEKPVEEIRRQILALNPEPGTWTMWNGKVLNILEGEPFRPSASVVKNLPPGTVLKIGNKIAILTQNCCLEIKILQLEGNKKTDVRSFINGHPNFPGSQLN